MRKASNASEFMAQSERLKYVESKIPMISYAGHLRAYRQLSTGSFPIESNLDNPRFSEFMPMQRGDPFDQKDDNVEEGDFNALINELPTDTEETLLILSTSQLSALISPLALMYLPALSSAFSVLSFSSNIKTLTLSVF